MLGTLRRGDPDVLARVAASILVVRPGNLVERPWGGDRLVAYQGLDDASAHAGRRFGEVFEVSGDPRDPESSRHPSVIELPDGTSIDLPDLLEAAGAQILGPALLAACGPRLPLLPKTLHVAELLSIQTHPPGNPEAYLILEAAEGATIRLGFREDVDGEALRARLEAGRKAQEELAGMLRADVSPMDLQEKLGPAWGDGTTGDGDLLSRVETLLDPEIDRARARDLLDRLGATYRAVLGLLNEIPVSAGMMVFNGVRDPRAGGRWSADVHGLGNPEGRDVLLLEIRRPATTLRAWDHVRFPMRELSIPAAIAQMSLRATSPGQFLVEPRPSRADPRVLRSVVCDSFVVDHLRPAGAEAVELCTAGLPQTLHVVRGEVEVVPAGGGTPARLGRGRSALLPAALGGYRVAARVEPAEVVRVTVTVAPGAPGGAPARAGFLRHEPIELGFGTSGLRGRVRDMTDLEVSVNVRGFLRYLVHSGDVRPSEPVALAEDLRAVDPSTGQSSSPRIARAVAWAIRQEGFRVLHGGQVPTPALAAFALHGGVGREGRSIPGIMVTGSHIPADRNGIKFYTTTGEILKNDEAGIFAAVARVRAEAYAQTAEDSLFDEDGLLKEPPEPEPVHPTMAGLYRDRYLGLFRSERPLSGFRLVLYEHSAVGRDLMREILAGLGAQVLSVDRTDRFVAVDTEDVDAEDEARYADLIKRHDAHALVSTDGDGDRPLVVDETGRFHRGDVVGIVTAAMVGARFAAVPVSASDALELWLEQDGRPEGREPMEVRRTRIGSPFVIAAMDEAVARGEQAVVGWEANGGFLTATEVKLRGRVLAPLPTRDAVLPILAVLLAAAEREKSVSRVFAELPFRATRAGLVDDFPPEVGRRILDVFGGARPEATEIVFDGEDVVIGFDGGDRETLAAQSPAAVAARGIRARLGEVFAPEAGFGTAVRVNYVDGVRIFFSSGDIAHLRPSGNAPQFRLYAVSDTQERADEIVALATQEPDGIIRRLEREYGGEPASGDDAGAST